MHLRTEVMPLARLKAAPYNPRRISDDAMRGLSASLKRFGLVQPIVWNERTQRIVGGHQRASALRDAGETEALVVVVDLPEVEEKALNVALNSPAIAGEFTGELQGLLDELKSADPLAFDDLLLGALHDERPSDDEWGDALDDLPSGDQSPIRSMSFMLHVDQLELVERALDAAAGMGEFGDTGNPNAKGNAIARICEMWLGSHG
jgi:hypothetical protein